jgi:hypothetical protein
MMGVVHRMAAHAREGRRRIEASDGARLIVLTLYYLAIIVGLFATHVTPDYRATPFVYQAF